MTTHAWILSVGAGKALPVHMVAAALKGAGVVIDDLDLADGATSKTLSTFGSEA